MDENYRKITVTVERKDERSFDFLVPNSELNEEGQLKEWSSLREKIIEDFACEEIDFDKLHKPDDASSPDIDVSSVYMNRGECRDINEILEYDIFELTNEQKNEQKEKDYVKEISKFLEESKMFWDGEGYLDDNGKYHPNENRGGTKTEPLF